MTEVEVFDREDAGGWEMEVRDDKKIYKYTVFQCKYMYSV